MSEHIGPAGPGRDLSDGETIHVLPIDDEVMHENTRNCVCIPDVEHVPNDHGPDGWLYTHHSLDGREANEPR